MYGLGFSVQGLQSMVQGFGSFKGLRLRVLGSGCLRLTNTTAPEDGNPKPPLPST